MTDLSFSGAEADYQALVTASNAGVSTTAVPNLSRPLILSNVLEHADAVLGRANPQGRLPFELPPSMEEVKAKLPDVPNDTANHDQHEMPKELAVNNRGRDQAHDEQTVTKGAVRRCARVPRR